ncbi:hypothetical protein SELMODRAFT_432412 [Selaginella moellendorffii]|uniref:Uncharacterized protein n=1 Tax=Selaginella moellendorffii TaxID=88036 RepID=D8TFX5_SELML|nr:hypothetical protein SELMODRAFT_432412 [Selaginella moellendorffii]
MALCSQTNKRPATLGRLCKTKIWLAMVQQSVQSEASQTGSSLVRGVSSPVAAAAAAAAANVAKTPLSVICIGYKTMVVRGMLRHIGQEYAVDFTFGESMVHDPVIERDYFLLIMSPKDLVMDGRFYPADEEDVCCTAVILDNAQDAERNQYMLSNVQKVLKDGEVFKVFHKLM